MKILFILFLIITSFNVCSSQEKKSKAKPIEKKRKLLSYILISITTTGNGDNYYEGSLLLQGITDKSQDDSILLLNSDTFLKRIEKVDLGENNYGMLKLRIKTPIQNYIINIGFLNQLTKWHDTISYVLNYDSLDYKETDLIEKERIRNSEIESLKSDQIKEVVISDAEQSTEYYRNKIKGKSHNKIADYLYDEGFGRGFSSSGSVFKEIFEKNFYYENNSYYKIIIVMWYSYGYGNLYYDVSYSYYINGKYNY